MRPREDMVRYYGGLRYTVRGATLLAHDEYWDGNNWERRGRNTFLYRTPRGNYFAVHLTQWQGETDRIEPLDPERAYSLYEALPEHERHIEEAFPDVVIEDA